MGSNAEYPGTQILVETDDWIVVGYGDDRDYGVITDVRGSIVDIAWASEVRTTVDVATLAGVEVYPTRDAARAAV